MKNSRKVLRFAVAVLVFAVLFRSAPSLHIAQSQSALTITHGPISGEVTASVANLWARASGAGTLTFEVSENADFSGQPEVSTVEVSEAGDFTGQVTVSGLEAATRYYYRVSAGGDAKSGQFRTTPASDEMAAFSFLLGACLGGQGYCRDPQTGWQIFETMRAQQADFFLMTGDGIYAGSPCPTTDNRNVPGAEQIATDLTSFRARYKYHLEDEHYAKFLAETPIYTGWDDHEVRDNYSGPLMQSMNPQMLAQARQAYFEYWPMEGRPDAYQLYRKVSYGGNADIFILDTRSYRDPLVNWDPSPRTLAHKTMLGKDQLQWLKDGLAQSTARWKFVVTSVPLAFPTGFPQPEVDGRDGWANAADRSGYENELMSLLFFIENRDLENVVFLSGDAHWPFAISYDPDRDGTPNFYEFSSSPLSAIVLAPVPVDQTFNPTVLYAEGEFQGTLFNFGQVSVTAEGALTFRIIDREGTERFTTTIQPK